MCGIYGITARDPEFIQSYINKCSHRGPDGSDIWFDDNITLGHNLLSITSQPALGKQPWHTETGVLIYNGEIFNYDDLKERFSNQWRPQTTCDTELLVWMLSNNKEGIDSMHAYAWYDKS